MDDYALFKKKFKEYLKHVEKEAEEVNEGRSFKGKWIGIERGLRELMEKALSENIKEGSIKEDEIESVRNYLWSTVKRLILIQKTKDYLKYYWNKLLNKNLTSS